MLGGMRTLPGLLALTLLAACAQEAGRPLTVRVVADHSARTQACDVLVGSLAYVTPAGNVPLAVVAASAPLGEVVEQQGEARFGPAQAFTASAQCLVWADLGTGQRELTTASEVSVNRAVTEEEFARGLTLWVTPPTEIGERPRVVVEPSAVR